MRIIHTVGAQCGCWASQSPRSGWQGEVTSLAPRSRVSSGSQPDSLLLGCRKISARMELPHFIPIHICRFQLLLTPPYFIIVGILVLFLCPRGVLDSTERSRAEPSRPKRSGAKRSRPNASRCALFGHCTLRAGMVVSPAGGLSARLSTLRVLWGPLTPKPNQPRPSPSAVQRPPNRLGPL